MPTVTNVPIDPRLKPGNDVYFSFLCMHALKERCLKTIENINDDTCEVTLVDKTGSTTLRFGLERHANGSITLTVESPHITNLPEIKGIKEYSTSEIAQVIANQSSITFYPEQKTFSVKLSDESIIGGPDKIDLYELHISNLGQILQYIGNDHFNDNMLVSLTTGSGKTFTQALWMLVLAKAGQHATFAVPASLLEQFRLDLTRLLPNDFFEKHSDIITIESVENVLNHPRIAQNDFFCFDEAHLIASREDLFLKAKDIAGQKPVMFLTATPTPALKSLASGNEGRTRLTTVASMNNAQKVANGYAERVESVAKSAKSIQELRGHFDFHSKLADLFDREKGYDASLPFGEAYLYHVNQREVPPAAVDQTETDKLRKAVRWAIQPAAFQGKTLICANHFEVVVNLDLFARQFGGEQPTQPHFNQGFYNNGNLFNRDNTYQFLQIRGTTPDQRTYMDYAQSYHDLFARELVEKIAEVQTQNHIAATAEEITALKDEIMAGLATAPVENSKHGIVELMLSILASKVAGGPDNLTDILQNFGGKYLDEQRINDLAQFSQSLTDKAAQTGADELRAVILYDETTNPRGLTEAQTNELLPLLQAVKSSLVNGGPVIAQRLTDNWFADATLFDLFGHDVKEQFNTFAKKHYKKYVFNQVEKNETITQGQVFNGFTQQSHGIGVSNAEAGYAPKVRTKRAVEALNPRDEEVVFTPESSEEDTQTNADNLFRLGITTLYCTDTKVAGFNDPNLHQVAVLAHGQENELANPANVIQAYGRNRGLNRHKTPNFFLITQKGVQCLFGDEELNKDDYKGDYDKALKKFKPVYINKLGQQLADNILLWIESNRDALHEVDDERLSDEVIQYLFNTLEEINKTNAYRFDLSVNDFETVLNKAIRHLHNKKADMLKGTPLALFARVIACLAFWAAKIMQALAARGPANEIERIIRNITPEQANESESKRARFYHKAVSIPFETVGKHDTAQKLIGMSIWKEAQGLKQVRDKYYSAMLTDPLACLDKSHGINSDVETLLKGLCSLIALSKVENKEALYGALQVLRSDVNPEQHAALLKQILQMELNPEHRERKLHLDRINTMLALLGQEPQKDVSELQEYCRAHDEEIRLAFIGTLVENQENIRELAFTEDSAKTLIDHVSNTIAEDIKALIHPFISEPAYRKMLQFVNSQFTDAELQTALGLPEDEGIVRSLRTFIRDTINPPGDYYHKYCLPETNALLNNSGNPEEQMDPGTLPFVTNLGHIKNFFDILHESHLRFYKMSEVGEVTQATGQTAPFFSSMHTDNPVLRAVTAGYDIVLRKSAIAVNEVAHSTLKKPMTIYFHPLGDSLFEITQVHADGTEISETLQIPPDPQLPIHADLQTIATGDYIVNHQFSRAELEGLNNGLINLPGFETLLSPAVNDENTQKGKQWRNILGLQTLKQALPIFDSTQRLMRAKEIDKALEVSSGVLKGIVEKDLPHSSNPLVAKGKMFNHILMEERKRDPKPSRAALGQQSSRVEKMKVKYDALKEQYDATRPSPDTKNAIIERINHYIDSRGETGEDGKLKAKSSRFFNTELTSKKLGLAQRLVKKIETDLTFADTLSLIEDAIREHGKIMRTFDKNPASSCKFGDILDSIHEGLLDASIRYRP